MNVIVAGEGKAVYFIAKSFISKGHRVTIVNRDREECRYLARNLKATIVNGDASKPRTLQDVEASVMNAVIALTPHDHDNLVICQIAARHFHIEKTLALVNDPDNEEVFKKLGIDVVFSPSNVIASLIEQRTRYDSIRNLLPLGNGKISLFEISLEEKYPVINKTLREIKLPDNSLVVSIMRSEQPIIPRGDTKLEAGDQLLLISLPRDYPKALKIITGE